MEKLIICRHGYCQKCYEHEAPHENQLVLLLGEHGYYVKEAINTRKKRGYVPKLYQFQSIQNDTVLARTICCMGSCAIHLRPDSNGQYNFVILDRLWEEIEMGINDWKALIQYTRDLDYAI